MKDLRKLTIFYDGRCPLCQAEIVFLSRKNQAELLHFVDINSQLFQPEQVGISCEKALSEMHGLYEDGELIVGVEVFAQSYKRVNLKLLSWIFSRTILRSTLNVGYKVFAKNRHFISKTIGPFIKKLVE
jgi:predicted DCC family thiol-disulfide oxidoreductase YuxK